MISIVSFGIDGKKINLILTGTFDVGNRCPVFDVPDIRFNDLFGSFQISNPFINLTRANLLELSCGTSWPLFRSFLFYQKEYLNAQKKNFLG